MRGAARTAPSPLTGPLAIFDRIYRFLASLKLAVITLGTLASVLAYATFFESWYGAAAVQEWIYKSKGFAVLLAFLGANILCAALIRFPWKRRQIGFVITHAGLLILLAGSWKSVQTADEGQVGMLEGEVRNQLVRIDYPVLRVRPLDPKSGEPTREYELPFRPGAFAWGPGNPRPRGMLASVFHAVTLGLFRSADDRGVVVTDTRDPFQIVAKAFLPSSMPSVAHVPDPSGSPMAKIRPRFKGPNMAKGTDVFEFDDQRWFKVEKPAYRAVKSQGPAQFVFLSVDRPELVEDFLHPPKDAGKTGAARFRYQDKTGKPRTYDWALDGQEGKSLTLPESDLTVTFGEVLQFPAGETGFGRVLGDTSIPIAEFKVKKGDGADVPHYGWASLPMFPNIIPTQREPNGAAATPLVAIDYYLPPTVDPATNGRFGVVEVLGTPQGALYYRVFGRGENGVGSLRGEPAPLKPGREVVAFGGNPNQPMTITFEVEEYLTAGREKDVCEAVKLPQNQMGNGIPATLVDMTVAGHAEEFWLRRSRSLEPLFHKVSFPGGDYEVALDFDRRPLGFEVKLVDFEVGFDPGTQQPASFVSQVLLEDEAHGIKDQPVTISMNEPMEHRGFTFYQSSYDRHRDPKTGREDGRFLSIFQVATDPGRYIKYAGCILVCLGAFVQFYMRAGLFSDTAKSELTRLVKGQGPAKDRADVEIVNEADETL